MADELTITCVVCGRSRALADSHILKLTPEERKIINTPGLEPVLAVAYCRPCYRLMSDQRTALDLLKGSLIARLRVLGVPNAEEVAERFKNRLLSKSSSKRSS